MKEKIKVPITERERLALSVAWGGVRNSPNGPSKYFEDLISLDRIINKYDKEKSKTEKEES